MAAVRFGEVGNSEGEGTRDRGRSERGSGRCRGTRGGVQKRRKQEVASRADVRGDHTPSLPLASFWREVGDGGGSGGLGQLLGRGGAPGMSR